MPIYSYVCTNKCCDKINVVVDRLVMRMEDRFFQECKLCGEPLYMQVSAASFVFKGDSSKNNWGLK